MLESKLSAMGTRARRAPIAALLALLASAGLSALIPAAPAAAAESIVINPSAITPGGWAKPITKNLLSGFGIVSVEVDITGASARINPDAAVYGTPRMAKKVSVGEAGGTLAFTGTQEAVNAALMNLELKTAASPTQLPTIALRAADPRFAYNANTFVMVGGSFTKSEANMTSKALGGVMPQLTTRGKINALKAEYSNAYWVDAARQTYTSGLFAVRDVRYYWGKAGSATLFFNSSGNVSGLTSTYNGYPNNWAASEPAFKNIVGFNAREGMYVSPSGSWVAKDPSETLSYALIELPATPGLQADQSTAATPVPLKLATPTFGAIRAGDLGFTAPMSNFDSALTYSVKTSLGTGVVTSTGLLRVTGIPAGTEVAATVTASNKVGSADSAVITGQALPSVVAPVLAGYGTEYSIERGFSSLITNWDPTYTYTASVWEPFQNASAIVRGNTLEVKGLPAGAAATVKLTASKVGYSDATINFIAAALKERAAPIFDTPIPLPVGGGFTVQVTNYDRAFTWNTSSTAGRSSIDYWTGLITVLGLADGESATVTAVADEFGFVSSSGSVTGSAPQAPATPTKKSLIPALGTITRSAAGGGFSFLVTNLDPTYAYAVSTSAGSASFEASTGLVTVTGLTSGQSATVTVTGTKAGDVDVSATTTGSAFRLSPAPKLGPLERSVAGAFSFYVSASWGYEYSVESSAGVASYDYAKHVVTVSGLAPGQSAVVTIRGSYGVDTIAEPATLTGQAPLPSPALAFGQANEKFLERGFSFPILNFDRSYTYTATATFGLVSVDAATGVVTVIGLTPDHGTLVTVNASKSGFETVSATRDQLYWGIGLQLGTPYPTESGGGFTVAATTESSRNWPWLPTDYEWTASATAGSASIDSKTGVVTVKGLASGQVATVTVTATKAGYVAARREQTGQALVETTKPELGDITQNAGGDGFSFQVTNFDAASTWWASTTAGIASINATGRVQVGLLHPGERALVTVTARKGAGYASAATATSGQALLEGLRFDLSGFAYTEAADGFRVQVLGFDPSYSWSASSSAGTATIDLARGFAVVSGLRLAQDATVTVTASKPGYMTRTTWASGSALPASPVPPFGAIMPTETGGGFSVMLNNYARGEQWSAVTTAGNVSIAETGMITVSGLAPGESATVTVEAKYGGYIADRKSITGHALLASAVPVLGDVIQSEGGGGFRFAVSNFDPAFAWTVSSSSGSVTIDETTGIVTVAGLSEGQEATVTVEAAKNGYARVSAFKSATSVYSAIVPDPNMASQTEDGLGSDPAVTKTSPVVTAAVDGSPAPESTDASMETPNVAQSSGSGGSGMQKAE